MKNLILRTVTGALFVLVLVTCIVYSPVTFSLLFAVLSALTTWEFASVMNRRAEVHVNCAVSALAAAYLFVASTLYVMNPDVLLFVPYILAMLYLGVSELYRFSNTAIGNWAFTMMAQMYVAIPFALLNVLEFWGHVMFPGYIVLLLFIFLWCSDTGAYCTGSLIGRHKLFPSVSPGKTWEGSIGGGVLAVGASQLIVWLCNGNFESYVCYGGMALVVVVFGTWGDLVESLLKRRLGIKDSGEALPGHGGWLDRFDSCLLATPAAVVYLVIWESLSTL